MLIITVFTSAVLKNDWKKKYFSLNSLINLAGFHPDTDVVCIRLQMV